MSRRTADYIRVVDSITAQIRAGEFAPGDKLPTYAQFADRFKISVTTAQTALRILRERGLVEGHQGKGTYVSERPELGWCGQVARVMWPSLVLGPGKGGPSLPQRLPE
ncbi:winged helix-turn-helix domain-containing protein [Salinispora pacifica]|uniref:winged helix-turn-helix domain-containing protein n=1 Tax=Salinispora pacifica TaxID=351187 RepID=UPI0004B15628|nr:winged helix-turn-helix domain-containing protein [Salinispora pacifica]